VETTANQERFSEYYGLANRIIEVAEKDTLADVARLLAVHIARYQSKYGKLSMEGTVELLHSDTVTDEQLGTMADGMEYLVSLLGVAAGLVGDDSVQ